MSAQTPETFNLVSRERDFLPVTYVCAEAEATSDAVETATIEIAVIYPPLRILPQIVFSYFWSFPQIVKSNLGFPQIVFWL